jgi:hypothetical protein
MATVNLIDLNWWGLLWLGNAFFWGWSLWFKKKLKVTRQEHINTLRELEQLLIDVRELQVNRRGNTLNKKKKIKPEKRIKKFKL